AGARGAAGDRGPHLLLPVGGLGAVGARPGGRRRVPGRVRRRRPDLERAAGPRPGRPHLLARAPDPARPVAGMVLPRPALALAAAPRRRPPPPDVGGASRADPRAAPTARPAAPPADDG